MQQCHAIMLLIIIIFIIYWLTYSSSTTIKNNPEFFTILKDIQSPLTSYDDYATFNFIHHTNDLPYYDPTYNNMVNLTKTNTKYPNAIPKWNGENFSKDSFIRVCGNKVRRELVPSNYSDQAYANADFTNSTINENIAPQAVNFYFH
ncbi:putative ORFan [Tupanvirus deep ocean]|uniref:ORFan n=2 Tax=Tupanvirus TaxID=2094720 RepID=A0AC62A8L2_9VIRU|nr:putative ORFan [Tupanvirus deep ocean]QKU33993.1 putative ORFan [Tupanvirus deep ocean]